jgi:hypothetical protein
MKDQPPDFEDRWKEPQHGIRGRNERNALVSCLSPLRTEAGSWTSEDEVQVTEDRPRPAPKAG